MRLTSEFCGVFSAQVAAVKPREANWTQPIGVKGTEVTQRVMTRDGTSGG
jgi:hypothetical protein